MKNIARYVFGNFGDKYSDIINTQDDHEYLIHYHNIYSCWSNRITIDIDSDVSSLERHFYKNEQDNLIVSLERDLVHHSLSLVINTEITSSPSSIIITIDFETDNILEIHAYSSLHGYASNNYFSEICNIFHALINRDIEKLYNIFEFSSI